MDRQAVAALKQIAKHIKSIDQSLKVIARSQMHAPPPRPAEGAGKPKRVVVPVKDRLGTR